MQQACFIASPRDKREVMSKSEGRVPKDLRGAERPHPVLCWAASRRPAYAAISGLQHRLPVPRARERDAQPTTLGFHPRRVVRRPPRPDRVTPGARARLAAGLGPCCPAPSSGAASLTPRYRRSAARVLMDEGWAKCKRAARAGDKFPRGSGHSGASRNPVREAPSRTGYRRSPV